MSEEQQEQLGEHLEVVNLRDLDVEDLKKIGLDKIKVSASADTKVNIAQYESMGVWAEIELTFDLSLYTGTLPVTQIFNDLALPIRNSASRFAHADTMGRVNEMRAIIEGVRDGKSFQDIEREVQAARRNSNRLMQTVLRG